MGPPSGASSPWSSSQSEGGGHPLVRRALYDATPILLLLLTTIIAVTSLPAIYGMAFRPRVPAAKRGIARFVYARGLLAKPSRSTRFSGYPQVPGHAGLFGDSPLAQPPRLLPPNKAKAPLVREFSVDDPGIGVARRTMTIRKQADPEAPVVAQVGRGKALAVVKELGTWLLVAIRQDDRMLFGWAKNTDVAVLP